LTTANDLRIKIFADGADIETIVKLAQDPLIAGFTTNPTLMRQAGVGDYEGFARKALDAVPDRPISLEVLADEEPEMERQALAIASWGANVYVKIPVTNASGTSTAPLVRRLSGAGVKVNVTALMTARQVESVLEALAGTQGAVVSVFAGRIADSGRDPIPIMEECLRLVEAAPAVELLWASPREVLNIVQADAMGCHIITVTHDLLKKLPSLGRDLDDFSLDTVRMFLRDAVEAGFSL
jgi:transaldolase